MGSYGQTVNNIITIIRGDSYEFDLTINDDSSESGRYILQDDDAIYFGLMDPHQPFEDALVKKKYTVDDIDEEGNLAIKIFPEDTLDLVPGKYYYSIKLKMDHINEYGEQVDRVDTIVQKTKFIICD